MNALSFNLPKPVLRGHVYYFRLRIPAKLLPLYGKKREIVRSLRTKDYDEALERILHVALDVEQEFREKRRLLAAQAEQTLAQAGIDPSASIPSAVTTQVVTSLPLRPFALMDDTERKTLLLKYKSESSNLAYKELNFPPPEDEIQARKELEENEELMKQLAGDSYIPSEPPAFFSMSKSLREKIKGKAEMFCQVTPLCLMDGDIKPFLPYVEAFLSRHGYALPPGYGQEDDTDSSSLDSPETQSTVTGAEVRAKFHEFCMKILPLEAEVQAWVLAFLNGEPWAISMRPPFNGSLTPFQGAGYGLPRETPASPSEALSGPALAVSPAQAGGGLALPSGAGAQAIDDPMKESEDNPLFSAVAEDYFKAKGEGLAPNTIQEIKQKVRCFIELNGDLPIKAYDKRKHIIHFKNSLLKLPSNWARKFNGKTLPEVLRVVDKNKNKYENTKKLSINSINEKYLSFVQIIFRYALNEAIIKINPCEGVKATDNTRSDIDTNNQSFYSQEELSLIFNKSALFTNDKNDLGEMGRLAGQALIDYRWLLLLGLYTGARIEELAQLDRADIKQEAGIWYIYIHGDPSTNRRVKNKSSVRKVPIHKHLLDIGFVKSFAKSNTGGKLFSTFTAKASNGKMSNGFSRWFSRYIDSLGLSKENRKIFHAFRHSLKHFGRQILIDDRILDCIQGHTQQGVSAHYGLDEEGKQFGLPVLKTQIDKIEYGLDIEKLRECMGESC